MKKKIFALAAGLCLVLGMAGCGKKEDAGTKDVPVSQIRDAVAEAYGENYFADYQMSEEEAGTLLQTDTENWEEFVAEKAMISTRVDTFVAVKAKEGKAEDVKGQMESYQEYLKKDTMQYPMNLPKIQASEVKVYGDYVFFIMLGAADEEGLDEEAALKFYQEQNQVAVKAIEGVLL